MTLSSTQVFGAVNIIGGAAVLGSYVYGLIAFPELRQSLWGGIDGRWKAIFALSMVPAAAGYLVFGHFMIFRSGLESFDNGVLLVRLLPHLLTAFFLVSSFIWMPATLSYLNTGNVAWWHAATAALWVTAASLLVLLGVMIFQYLDGMTWPTVVALVGLSYVTFHCVVLDAMMWIGRFPRLD